MSKKLHFIIEINGQPKKESYFNMESYIMSKIFLKKNVFFTRNGPKIKQISELTLHFYNRSPHLQNFIK